MKRGCGIGPDDGLIALCFPVAVNLPSPPAPLLRRKSRTVTAIMPVRRDSRGAISFGNLRTILPRGTPTSVARARSHDRSKSNDNSSCSSSFPFVDCSPPFT